MYTEFENFLYNSENDFTTEKLNLEYKQLIEKYYGNEFDMKEEAFTDWTRLGHIYRWAYYPFKYATGLIMANIVVDSLNNKTLTEGDYCKFLSLGSSVALDKLLEVLHIDLANEKIVETGFKKMETSLITCRNLLKDDIQNIDDELTKYINEKIEERNKAKQDKNYELSDSIRNELLQKGIILKDTREGTIFEIKK